MFHVPVILRVYTLCGFCFLHWLGKGLAHRKLERFPYPAQNCWNMEQNPANPHGC